jgi:hypothetical protein
MILEKKYYKKKNTKETGKKIMWGKTVSIYSVFLGKTCNYNS